MISQSRFLISQNFCDFLYYKIDFVKSKNRICHVKKSILWYQKLILWYQIIAHINNLINAHALNFVSAGIGNTPAFFFFFFFAWESLFHQLKILHILISQKRFCKSARIFDTKKSILWYKNIKFVTSKDRFSAKSQRFFFFLYHKMLCHKIDFVI